MTRYRIEPFGVEKVVTSVNRYAADELTKDAKAVEAAVRAVSSRVETQCPVRGVLGAFALASAGEIQAVYSATTTVLSAAANATNAYVEADIEMAQRGAKGVTVTSTYVSGFEGDPAQRGGERAIGGLADLRRLDALDARTRPSLTEWANQLGH